MAAIPEGAKKPKDHKAAQAEATLPEGPIEFDFREQHYVIDPGFRDDVEILEDIEDENMVRVVRRILGDKVWDQWKEANRGDNGRISVQIAKDFISELFEELGQGN